MNQFILGFSKLIQYVAIAFLMGTSLLFSPC